MIHRLSAVTIKTLKPGKNGKKALYADGGGLWLQVTPGADSPSRSWLFRYTIAKVERAMGLGPLDLVSLAQAREKAAECRKMKYEGIDPLDRRDASKASAASQKAKLMTFDQCAAAFIKSHAPGWRSAKSEEQWTNSLAAYASPAFGAISVKDIDTALVMQALEPIWASKSETANRVRGRIESILDWAKARGYRDGENPARQRGHVDHLLPARSKMAAVEHHESLPYKDLPAFMVELRQREGVVQRALEFTILTATRTGEVIGAKWSEIDLGNKVWTIPADRMKEGAEHRVPLVPTAMAVLEQMGAIHRSEYVFPGNNGRPNLSDSSMLKMLRRMGRSETVHGYRATFGTWAEECTDYPDGVREAAIAHKYKSETTAAYQRSDLFDKRRLLMTAWAEYCG